AKNAKNAGGGKKAGGGQQARAKQGGGQARSKQAARPQQNARPKQSAGRSQASRQRPSGGSRALAQSRPSAGHRGGGGGMRAGGGGRGGGGRGGGRRSDVRLKHDITLLGHLDNGLGFYRFAYNGSSKAYVGVMAQEVQAVVPAAVARGRDGYLRVPYDKLGLKFQTYGQWAASGARIPVGASTPP